MANKKILTDLEVGGDIQAVDLTASNRIYLGDGGNGYFSSDSDGRTAFDSGDLYIRNTVGTYYNYANVQYHGAGSGDSHRFRANELYGDTWKIDTDGNFGIGTTSPSSRLHVNGGTGSLSTGLTFGDGDTGIWESSDDNLRLSTASSTRMTIDSDGNVGIGTTSPTKSLSIAQSSDSDGLIIDGYDDNAGSKVELGVDSNGHAVLSQTTADSSGYLILEAENYLNLTAGTFVYTSGIFRIYDSGSFQLGSSGDYKLKYDNTNDVLNIHTDDNKGITIDNAGNVGIGTTSPGEELEVAGNIKSNSILVGTATGSVVGSIATIKSTSTSTGTNVNTWIDVNRAHTSAATGTTYGGVVRVTSNSSSLDGGVVGINPIGRQSGSGGAEYIYGSLNTAEQTGSGDVDFIIASSAKARSNGNGAGTIDYVRGFSLTAAQNNSSSTVNYLQGAHMTAELTAGTVGDVEIALLDWDQSGGTITGDLSYLRIQNDTVSNITGTARAIWSLSTLPSSFAGLLESTSFVKTGGTSSQFLKADGSVDTNTYLTSSDLSGFVDLTSAQTIAGNKTFTDDVYFDNSDNYVGTNVDDKMTMYGDLALRLETSDGVVVNLDDTASITGTTALVIANGGLDFGSLSASRNFAFPNASGTVALTSDISTDFVSAATGGTFGGNVIVEGDIKTYEGQRLVLDADGDEFAYIQLDTTGSDTKYAAVNEHHFINGDGGAFETVKAGSFVKDGGTSSQFLKADGSVDSTTYLTSSSTQSKYLRSDADDVTSGRITAKRFYVANNESANSWGLQLRNSAGTADSGIYWNGDSSDMYLRNSSNGIGARIRSNGASYFKGGNVGIGIDATEKLHISGEAHPSIKVQSSSDANYNFEQKVTFGDEAYSLSVGGYKVMTTEGFNTPEETYIYANNAKALSFASTGAATFSNTVTGTNFILSSDSRLKENVEKVDNKSINVDWKTFEMKSNKGQKRYGVIAQELEEVHPEFVRTDDEGMKSVAYVDLLIAKNAELEARLEKLEKLLLDK